MHYVHAEEAITKNMILLIALFVPRIAYAKFIPISLWCLNAPIRVFLTPLLAIQSCSNYCYAMKNWLCLSVFVSVH